MLWRSAPEANSTVAPRRLAVERQAVASRRTSRAQRRAESTAYSISSKQEAAAHQSRWRLDWWMLQALFRRALAGLAVIVGVVTLMFFLIRLAPGDPAVLLVGPTASPAQLVAQRKALGLD